ncbi:MAG: tetratricopeptide repeat protein [Rhodoferax sp.]
MPQPDRNAPCPCGSTKKYKHCCQRKESAQVKKTEASNALLLSWYQLGMQHLQAGRVQQARLQFEQVLQMNPRHAEAKQWLGVLHFQQGNAMRALELVAEAAALSPTNPVIHATFANLQQATGQSNAALASYQRAIELKPDFAEAHNNLGNALASQGRLAEATESYRRAVALQPGYAEAHNNLGTALQAAGLSEAAADAYLQAIALRPNYAQALCNLAAALQERAPEQSEEYARRALALQPNYYEAWVTLGKVLLPQGHVEQARAAIGRALALRQGNGLVVFSALMLPTIMGTREEVQRSREQFESNLERLIAQRLTLVDPLKELCGTNFQLAYHAANDRVVQQRVAYFYTQACPQLAFVAPHCGKTGTAGKRRKRIGFFSRFIARHSVALSYSRIIENLSNSTECEVVLISSHDPQKTSVQQEYPNFAGTYLRISLDLGTARGQIAALELDILVYLDIGMDPFSYFLAFARLAHTQCVFDGHPVTTGIPAMDYFLSVDLAEPENAQEHYSERLQRFPFGAYCFERPAIPERFKTRQELGMLEDANIYACPMVLFKIHPDFDEAINRILELDPNGRVVFFEDKKYSNWRKQLQSRFDKTIPATVRDRIVFMRWITDPMDFMSVIERSNVVLDPYHFGLGTTAIATCSVGTPFVTRPGEFVRGRYGYYYCKLLDVIECVATDNEDYAQKAVAIATNEEVRTRIKTKILANNGALFGNYQGIKEVKDFLLQI